MKLISLVVIFGLCVSIVHAETLTLWNTITQEEIRKINYQKFKQEKIQISVKTLLVGTLIVLSSVMYRKEENSCPKTAELLQFFGISVTMFSFSSF